VGVLVTPPLVSTGPCRRAPLVELTTGLVFAIDVAPGWGVHGVASCIDGAAHALPGWRSQLGRPHMSMVVDLGLTELVGMSADDICNLLARNGIGPDSLVVRVPHFAAGDPTEDLDRLAERGVTIAVTKLDLRGASAGLLAGAPIDLIELPGHAIAAVDGVEEAADEIALAIEIAHRHDWLTVARDVTRPAQLAVLRRLGCDLAAGAAVAQVWPAIDDALALLPASLAS
jgi:EAL domain-containing protein (putative c-di-GMP-specific phosphodiesterase class I)